DFVAMSTGKADPNKLYFGGKMKVGGNVMASQKLAFLQKMDPKLLAEAMQSRSSAPAAAAPKEAAQAPKEAKSGAIFAALQERLKGDAKNLLNGLAGQVLQFNVSAPDASWVLDLSGKTPKLEQGRSDKAAAVFGIADADLALLAGGKAGVRDLYQRGKLRVDGDVRLARELGFLNKLA
ncbi:MAG: SCP2 sterol-binding domain-containing protein, partial [Nevskia sp.]|nr:SCP2 sterol-binding domain-containing protein [Nevskia sp.]